MSEASLTIAYVTARKDPKIEWFFDSLCMQRQADSIELVVVDHWHDERGHNNLPRFEELALCSSDPQRSLRHVAPKPNVWSGAHRLTKQDWFSAANSRNTALALCRTSHIAFVDDLSVLMPGWLNAVKEAVAGNYIGLGSYKKVKNLIVLNGAPFSYTETPEGTDNRLSLVNKDLSECTGSWLYGCSLVAPIEAFLTINGWNEACDSLGSEDYCTGITLQNAGFHLKYDRRMLTLESEELHFVEPPMRKEDWHFENGVPVIGGNGSTDKSHAILNIALNSKWNANYFDKDLRSVREQVLKGEPFPIQRVPEHEWYTGKELASL